MNGRRAVADIQPEEFATFREDGECGGTRCGRRGAFGDTEGRGVVTRCFYGNVRANMQDSRWVSTSLLLESIKGADNRLEGRYRSI